MSFQPINGTTFNPLNLDMNKTEPSKEINNLRVLHGDESKAQVIKDALNFMKNLQSSAFNHSTNIKLIKD